ncbi:MAG: methylmalonyl Co-A mutase-associated GTPase MeaB [Deltaproteobacteria bacterium]|nr:methylmalonyl Co-A mutase-associated GTPase MeaB [Deltaproteobacteria bacterium]
MNDKTKKPEWVPPEGGEEYASHVMDGVDARHDGMRGQADSVGGNDSVPRRRDLTVDDHVSGVLAGDRTILARTITLIESNTRAHQDMAQEVLKGLLPNTGKSIRVGITGVPGVGKSTFIDTLGSMLTERGSRVAVLAVDPSSSVTGGSILGDKTRMERLARDPNAFIRPSPAGGTLGGVARKSRETILVCEAAGFDVLLVETVGVGQSEVTGRSMVDFFLLLMIAGAGDELQGIKRGVMELADALAINKADGDNLKRAAIARAEYERALHYLLPATEGWQTQAYTCSAVTEEGVLELWDVIKDFIVKTTSSGAFVHRRTEQILEWLHAMVEEHLRADFFNNPRIKKELPDIEKAVTIGELPATSAVEQLVSLFRKT